MNALDRFIGYFSPKTGLIRARTRAQTKVMAAYVGASYSRQSMKGWLTSTGDADADTLPDLSTLRDRSRDLHRNTPIARGALSTCRTNVVGPGLRLQSSIDREFLGMSDEEADAWERQAEREFNLWAKSKDCDATRIENFYQLQGLVFLSTLMSGDVFVLMPQKPLPHMPYALRLQVIEADRVRNPEGLMDDEKLSGGIELDPMGAPTAYYFSNRHPGSIQNFDTGHKRIPAFGRKTGRRNVLHLYDRERPGQRRGVPYLAPVIESLKQLGRYTEAELMAAVVSAFFTVFVKSENPDGLEVPFYGNEKVTDENNPSDQNLYELGPGAVVSLAPWEDITAANPNRPNQVFDKFVLAILQQIGAGLDIPVELLIKHFTASYSASRAALLEAWKFFRVRRAWLADGFCHPVYEEWMSEAVYKGRTYAPGFFADAAIRAAYLGSNWIGPAQGQLDPLKEVNAAAVRVSEGFSTRAEETQALTGGDFERNHKQRAKEERMRKEDGLAIEAKATDQSDAQRKDDDDDDDEKEQ